MFRVPCDLKPPPEGWPEGYDPSIAWSPDEWLYAVLRRSRWHDIEKAIRGPNGDIRPGRYVVVFESYDNVTERIAIRNPQLPSGEALTGTIVVQHQDSCTELSCILEERVVAGLLTSIVNSALCHKELRLPDREAALNSMLKFIDPCTYSRCAHNIVAVTDKLASRLMIDLPVATPVFQQISKPFDLNEFRLRLATPTARIWYSELRAWLNVEHETLNAWLVKARMPDKKHGKTYNCSVSEFREKFVPYLRSIVETSPIGDKIQRALASIGMA